MLCIYSIPFSNDDFVIGAQDDLLYDLLPFSITWKFWSDIIEVDNRSNSMLYYFMLGDTTQCYTAHCHFTPNPP